MLVRFTLTDHNGMNTMILRDDDYDHDDDGRRKKIDSD